MNRAPDHIRFFIIAPLIIASLCGVPVTPGWATGEGAQTYPGYVPVEPPIIVNLADERRARFLRVDIQFRVQTAEDAKRVEEHAAFIRDRLIGFLGGRDPEQLMSTESRDRLRTEILSMLQLELSRQAGAPSISEVYFTGFIVQ